MSNAQETAKKNLVAPLLQNYSLDAGLVGFPPQPAPLPAGKKNISDPLEHAKGILAAARPDLASEKGS